MGNLPLSAFFDELQKIAEGRERRPASSGPGMGRALSQPRLTTPRTETKLSVPSTPLPDDAMLRTGQAQATHTLPSPGPPEDLGPPPPPIAEQVKQLAQKGGVVLKNLETAITAPSAPHRYAGVAYSRDFTGFKYS